MIDLIYLCITLGFFAVCFIMVELFDLLAGSSI
jgi:hypothetical protein